MNPKTDEFKKQIQEWKTEVTDNRIRTTPLHEEKGRLELRQQQLQGGSDRWGLIVRATEELIRLSYNRTDRENQTKD